MDRRQDLLVPAARRKDALRPPQEPEEARESALGERRIANAIRSLRWDPAALERFLDELPTVERLTARLVLVRELGAGRASEMCDRAFGPGQALPPRVPTPPPAPQEAPSARLRWDLARAARLAARLGSLLQEGRPSLGDEALEILRAVEVEVARSALSLLGRSALADGRNARAALDEALGPRAGSLEAAADEGWVHPFDEQVWRAFATPELAPAPFEGMDGVAALLRRTPAAAEMDAADATDAAALVAAGQRWLESSLRAVAGRTTDGAAERRSNVIDFASAGQRIRARAVATANAGPGRVALASAETDRAPEADDDRVRRALAGAGRGGGQPLPAEVAARMGRLLGHDFAHVRVHADAEAAEIAARLHAHAVTLGSDIYFNAGRYAPGSAAGDRLLLHELTHVVQHDEGRLPAAPGGELTLTRPSDPSEQEARAMESRADTAPHVAPAPAPAPQAAPRAEGATTIAAFGLPGGSPAELFKQLFCSGVNGALNPMMIPNILMGWAWRILPDSWKKEILHLLLSALIAVVERMPSSPMFGVLWPIVRSGILGFLRTVEAKSGGPDGEKQLIKISDKLAKIMSGASPAFMIGAAKGFFVGLWDGIKDPFVMAYEVIVGLKKLVTWLQGPRETQLGRKLAEYGQRLGAWIQKIEKQFWTAIEEAFHGTGGPMQAVEAMKKLFDSMMGAVEGAAEKMGGQLGEKLWEFFLGDGAESTLGEKIGWVIGNVGLQVVITILSGGVWAEASAAMKVVIVVCKALNWPFEVLGLAVKGLVRLASLLKTATVGLVKTLGKAGGALAKEVIEGIESIAKELTTVTRELETAAKEGKGITSAGENAAAKDVAKTSEKAVAEGATETAGKEAAKEPVQMAQLVGQGDKLAEAAKWVKPEAGYFDVVVHGSPDSFLVLHNGKWVELNQRSMKTFLKTQGYKEGTPIRLISCESGAASDGIAKNLANKMGVEVKAPTETVWIHPDGNLTIGATPTAKTGKWETFKPGKVEKPAVGAEPHGPEAPEAAAAGGAEPAGPSDAVAAGRRKLVPQNDEQREALKAYKELDYGSFDEQEILRKMQKEGLKYDPKTKRFYREGEKPTIDFPAKKEELPPVDPDKLPPAAKKRMNEQLEKRSEAIEKRDAAKTKEAKEQVIPEINEASRQAGNEAAEAVVKQQHKGARRIYPKDLKNAASRNDDFDMIFKVDETGEIIVVESKGGAGARGSGRHVRGTDKFAEQGSDKYYDEVVEAMQRAEKGSETAKMGEELALADKSKVTYLRVQTKIETKVAGDGSVTSEAKEIVLHKFKLKK